MSAQEQIAQLAVFILNEVPGEPSENEGVVDTAIRLIRRSLSSDDEAETPRPVNDFPPDDQNANYSEGVEVAG